MVRMGRVAGAKVSGYQKFRTANFAGQFQPDGDGFLYRKGMKGAPIRVTAAERQRYIEEFEKSGRFVFWAGVTVGVLAPFALVFHSASGFDLSDWTVWAVVGIVLVLCVVGSYWTYHAPARDLRDRPKLGEPLTRAEMRKVSLRNLSYGQVALVAAVLVYATFGGRFGRNWSPEWKNAWLGFVAILLAALAFRAYQKWQMERSGKG